MRFFLLLLLQLSLHHSSAVNIPEHLSLLSLKTAISDDPSSALADWNASTSHCTWSHLTCDSRRHVTSIDLSDLNLSGTLSPAVAHLRFLSILTVAVNSLAGPIPPEIANLSGLRLLNFSNNVFNGSFPPQLSRLKRLQVLDLYNNEMTGGLPVEVAGIPSLRHLHLGGNFFAGSIPPEYGRWEFLEYLAVSGNDLAGEVPPELGNLTNLRELHLGYYNTFEGGLPAEIGNLSSLVRLDAASCGLVGGIPPEIRKLQSLDTLFLQANGFSGPLTPELGRLKSLKSMDLSNNAFTGEIPGSFSELKNLTLLNLFRNKLHGSIPEFIGDLPELEVLQLWENSFTGSIPQRLGRNRKLEFLDLSFNKLTGTLPPELCSGNRLETIITLGNFLVGPIPELLGECQSLSRIRMGKNHFNGSIPKSLFGLPNLTLVDLQDNALSGEFPATDSVSVNLGQVSLSNNNLTGSLPPTIGNFSGVQNLLLDSNKFSGRIPLEIGKLQQLSNINFSNNKFSGPIAPEISQCKLLTFIDLSRNDLAGEIPNLITTMKTLNYLNLSRNHLVGNIPPSISTMQSLTSLDFSFNNLSGSIPTTGQFSYTSFLGNPRLCDPFSKPCKDGEEHGKPSPSAPLKLILVIPLLLCSIAFAIAAVIKARALKKSPEARAWKLTAFQRLDFTSNDILDSLKEENIIGKGGAVIVYKGVMPSGDHVAVKRFLVTALGTSRDRGFNAEIRTLGRIRHRHIVRLLGFCSNYETNLLVYEYMPNGSLGEVLHGTEGGQLLWGRRYKIAVEAAMGLSYLHHDCEPLIIHRDVKSNNILLDAHFEAHVAHFGLAKVMCHSGTSEGMSAIAGSYGYIAPEYAYTLKVDEKSDVYSFGVVLLELISGRKPVGEFGDGVDIVQWMRMTTDSNKEGVMSIIDARLPSVPLHEAMHVLYVALLCVEEQAIERPTMREVVKILTELPKPTSSKQEELGVTRVSI